MENAKDSPGVYLPPPLVYVATFFAAVFLQKKGFINDALFQVTSTKIAGALLLAIALVFLFTSLRQFFQTRNTLVPIKPATSLQTTGIYTISRNPMYAGLAILYLGLACFVGNWWHAILFPLLLFTVQVFIIIPEEKYLTRRFGEAYLQYRKKVRRWV